MKKKIISIFFIFVALTFATYIFLPSIATKYHCYKTYKQLHLEVKKINYDVDNFFEYVEGGKGETIVFVHGFQSSKNTWIPYFKKFFNSYNLVAMDLPGHGNSSRPKTQKYDLQSMADSLALFIEKKNLHDFHLVGISMGGGCATIYAYKYPQNIKSLILINPLGIDQEKKSELQNQVEKGKNIFFPKNLSEFDEMTLFLSGKQLKFSNYFKEYFLSQMMKNYAFFKNAFKELLQNTKSIDDILPKITTPTLILISQNDRVIHPASYEYFVRLMPNAKPIRFLHGSHVLVDNYFEEAVKSMDDFIKSNQAISK